MDAAGSPGTQAAKNSEPIGFFEFLRTRWAAGGFSTEDVVACFLPLVAQVRAAHESGLVVPLDDPRRLSVQGGALRFPAGAAQPARHGKRVVEELLWMLRGQFEIVGEVERTQNLGDTEIALRRLDVGRRGAPLQRPVYLPGYGCWEQELGHHDPLTDAFSLGLILASLACDLDFREPEPLERFVACRRNLFELRPQLHPVLAKLIVQLTELDRHRRPQDLASVEQALANYREQTVDLDFDLARIPGFRSQDHRTREQVVLGRLRERLFELTRRNRLLQFQPTLQTVNLTYASVPLSFDIHNIRPDQILVWNDDLQRRIARGDALPLNKYLNFSEAIYLPSTLDRLLAESRRDLAEYGFAQLRLVVCFLHWADLKASPVEFYDSPLVLLPVRLIKTKGVRDSYSLEPLGHHAEINPVIRHLFQQNYGLELPDALDLTQGDLHAFHEYLARRIQVGEPGVQLEKVVRPRVEIVHEKARRRLDQYRRSARVGGRGTRTYLRFDYSYDPANFRPLGLRLFRMYVLPGATRLERIVGRPGTQSPPPSWQAPATGVSSDAQAPSQDSNSPSTTPASASEGAEAKAGGVPEEAVGERLVAHLQAGGGRNPYAWTFHLGNLVLSNFRYRKMSLVRDYDALLTELPENPAFDATYSLAERVREMPVVQEPELDERYDIVACDPTQATAIALARTGTSYIIQGPPGTGKSQTITNLIADYAARGQRVLFVCEKRAAIDVVFARLRQRGLGDLCCLIHDSQADKKSFVMDLRRTYESFLSEDDEEAGRRDLLRKMRAELRGLQRFDTAMRSAPELCGMPLRGLIDQNLRLAAQRPQLDAAVREQLPPYASWCRGREAIGRFVETLEEFHCDGILARHPLKLLSPRIATQTRPVELIRKALPTSRESLGAVRAALERAGIVSSVWETPALARQLVELAVELSPLASQASALGLVDPQASTADFERGVEELRRRHDRLAAAQTAARGWRRRIAEAELDVALERARELEGKLLACLRPDWWRLFWLLRRSYDFRGHALTPPAGQVLQWLKDEYVAIAAVETQRTALRERFALPGNVEEVAGRILAVRERVDALPESLRLVLTVWSVAPSAARSIDSVALADPALRTLLVATASFLDDFQDCGWEELDQNLKAIGDSLAEVPDFLHCLKLLEEVPPEIAVALRKIPLTATRLEAAIAEQTLETLLRADRQVHHFSSATRQRHAQRLAELYDQLLEANAHTVRQSVREAFLEAHREAQIQATAYGTGRRLREAEQARRFVRGCRELEHEFGKSMRYKAIRDLVAESSGEVIRRLKPVWLMSPLSVADTLPLNPDQFDVVIFDEASQITLEESVPPLFRARQAIVVGDEQQLPPTDFFAAKRNPEEEPKTGDDSGADGAVENESLDDIPRALSALESDSFLNHAAKNLPSRLLGWHYRSQSESLISFSNWRFYDGRLLTAPEERLPAPNQAPIEVIAPEQGGELARVALQRPLSFHFLPHGVYQDRTNLAEAEYIAHLVRGLLISGQRETIGIVAFSEAQQSRIEDALNQLGDADERFRELLDSELERENDGQYVGLLIKNLENMQGDERDIVILSICYGPDADRRMKMHFGPINKSGGGKRLNVAFSRAKRHMMVVSSMRADDIRNDYNDGAACLKTYLRYAEASSKGDAAVVERILKSLSRQVGPGTAVTAADDACLEQLAAALVERGFQVDRAVGQSQFRCDLAVRRDGDQRYRLGILVDHDGYYRQTNLLEREVQRPKLLHDFGWRIAVVLAKDWYRDPHATLQCLLPWLDSPA